MITKVSFGEAVNNGKKQFNTAFGNCQKEYSNAPLVYYKNFKGDISDSDNINLNVNSNEQTPKIKQFGASFVSNVADRAPALLILTGGFTAFDNLIRKVPVKHALKNNLKWVFAPVLLITSFVSAIIENKQINKGSNKK